MSNSEIVAKKTTEGVVTTMAANQDEAQTTTITTIEVAMEMAPNVSLQTLEAVQVPLESVESGQAIILHDYVPLPDESTTTASASANDNLTVVDAQDKPIKLVMGTIPTDKLLQIIRLMIHYKYMLTFLNRNILVGGVKGALNAAVPKFKNDLKAIDSQFETLIRSVPVLEQISADMSQYHVNLDQFYVTAEGKVLKVNWDNAAKKGSLETMKVNRQSKVATTLATAITASSKMVEQGNDPMVDDDFVLADFMVPNNAPTAAEVEVEVPTIRTKRKYVKQADKQASKRPTMRNKGTSTHRIPRPKLELDPEHPETMPLPDFRCSYHGCRFRSNTSLEEVKLHEERCHVNATMLNCPHLGCFSLYQDEHELNEHLEQYHTQPPSPESTDAVKPRNLHCPIKFCYQILSSTDKLKRHLRDVHPIQYESCSRCQKRYTKRYTLVMHVRTVHKDLTIEEQNALLLVPEDDEEDNNNNNNNKKEKKSKGLVERCLLEGCDIIFPNSVQLLKHIKEIHPDMYTTCKFCGKMCKTRQHLNIHHYHFHREGEYRCRERGCLFKAKFCVEVKRHEKREHQKPTMCIVEGCNELIFPQNVRAHNKEKHPELFEQIFECTWPGCIKKFDDQARLRRHIRTHSALKRYRCKWLDCNYASEQKGTVVAHVRVCHLKLPRTKREEVERNMEVHPHQDIYQFVDILNEESPF